MKIFDRSKVTSWRWEGELVVKRILLNSRSTLDNLFTRVWPSCVTNLTNNCTLSLTLVNIERIIKVKPILSKSDTKDIKKAITKRELEKLTASRERRENIFFTMKSKLYAENAIALWKKSRKQYRSKCQMNIYQIKVSFRNQAI